MEDNNRLVCKICEQSTPADSLQRHSIKCKEAAEIKQKVLSIKESLLALIDKAYHLKAHMTTSAAIHK